MTQIKPLKASELRAFCRQAGFNFKTTDDLPDFDGMLGQERAVDALSFAIEIEQPGYNMYLMGANGLGKHSLLKRFLDKASVEQSPADDWCYVYNFDQPDKPKAINLPAGKAREFREAMCNLVKSLDAVLPNSFESEEDLANFKATLERLINELKENFSHFSLTLNYLGDLQKNILTSLSNFTNSGHSNVTYEEFYEFLNFPSYEVNVIVDHYINGDTTNSPVIFEDNPTVQNLFGKIEYASQLGEFVTDYRYIKPGALHAANGGYLVIDADKLLNETDSWDTLKRILVKQKIELPATEAKLTNVCPITLQPEAIPLDVKVILVGSRSLYNHLIEADDTFAELFKVEVDFSDTVDCKKESLNQYAQVIATLVRKNKLLAFDQSAVEAVIEYGMRQVEDTTLLSLHMQSLVELLVESNYWAKKSRNNVKDVQASDVSLAIEKQIYRADRSRDQIYNEIHKGTVRIDVTGEKVATVNGLFVIESGRLEFSQPARITANVRIGDGDIIDIEREVDLGGPLHSKGVLILSSYLGSRYATGKPLSLSASLVFEQSYGSVDGDSAILGELCTLLSAISKVPIKQSIAVTGSVDQHGNVQAIGGINEKIEGFFDICKLKGLTGEQGVILPAINVQHVIIREDVLVAIERNQFSLYPVNTVDEAISLLTGLPAGERNSDDEFQEGTINFKVEQRLLELAELKHDDKDDHDDSEDRSKKEK